MNLWTVKDINRDENHKINRTSIVFAINDLGNNTYYVMRLWNNIRNQALFLAALIYTGKVSWVVYRYNKGKSNKSNSTYNGELMIFLTIINEPSTRLRRNVDDPRCKRSWNMKYKSGILWHGTAIRATVWLQFTDK